MSVCSTYALRVHRALNWMRVMIPLLAALVAAAWAGLGGVFNPAYWMGIAAMAIFYAIAILFMVKIDQLAPDDLCDCIAANHKEKDCIVGCHAFKHFYAKLHGYKFVLFTYATIALALYAIMGVNVFITWLMITYLVILTAMVVNIWTLLNTLRWIYRNQISKCLT